MSTLSEQWRAEHAAAYAAGLPVLLANLAAAAPLADAAVPGSGIAYVNYAAWIQAQGPGPCLLADLTDFGIYAVVARMKGA